MSDTKKNWLIYGAAGYTGELIAREAVRRGERPILAGRNAAKITALADQLGCPRHIFPLESSRGLGLALADADLVLNCAGPFSETAPELIDACIAAKVHYLDITGELGVIELAAKKGKAAAAAGVTVMPAVGFDVVPTDCMAAMLAERLPDATRLELAFAMEGGLSRGTAKTMLAAVPEGGRLRIAGRIEEVPVGYKTLQIPFHDKTRWAMTIPWGDVSSAYYTTGIENIAVYTAVPKMLITCLPMLIGALKLLERPMIANFVSRQIDQRVKGPTEEVRTRQRAQIWGRVVDRAGNRQSATMETPSGYALTVLTALEAVKRVRAGGIAAGFLTPALAFGAKFIREFPDVDFQWVADNQTDTNP
jgi:short subunit dehydrogenase-like uncharacterized protein